MNAAEAAGAAEAAAVAGAAPSETRLPPGGGGDARLLEVLDVSKRFGGIQALEQVSLSLESGGALGLIGPNGAGKTTLFDCISGVTRPDRGEIRFGGARIDHLPIYRRSRLGIGRTFQRLELFTGLSVSEHLLVAERERRGDGRLWKDLLFRAAPRREELERVDSLLAEVGLSSVAQAPIESLSLGQGRLVELARALAGEPRLLLLDEPSSGLSSRETSALAGVLNGVRRSRDTAILLVEHDLDLVEAVVPAAVVLDFGRVIAAGRLREIMADPAVRSAYLGDG